MVVQIQQSDETVFAFRRRSDHCHSKTVTVGLPGMGFDKWLET